MMEKEKKPSLGRASKSRFLEEYFLDNVKYPKKIDSCN